MGDRNAASPRLRTSLLVTFGMLLLATIGVATVFGRNMLGALSPPAPGHETDDLR